MKIHKATDELLDLIESERGLTIADRSAAATTLRSTNYYRFTGYGRHFQVAPRAGKNDYRAGSSFEQIVDIMRRDDELRVRLLVPLCEFEMTARTRFAHLSGRVYGERAFYLDRANHLSDSADTGSRIAKVRKELIESKHTMVTHYRRGDDDVSEIPIWVAVEVLSFGKIAWLIESLTVNSVREELADYFSYTRQTFPRVAQSLSALRNLCAHHNQVWNRYLSAQCPLPLHPKNRPRDISFDPQGLYPAVIALRSLTSTPASRTQLRVIERVLRDGSLHASGVLRPAGVV